MSAKHLFAVAWFLLAGAAYAQLRISLSSERNIFLQYEPAHFTVRVTNPTERMTLLSSDPSTGREWLTFIIYGTGSKKIFLEAPLNLNSETIEPGQTRSFTVDVTPHYALRETGEYKIQAAINLPGQGSFITDPYRFHIGKGNVIWTKEIIVNDVKRNISLIQFLEASDSSLYLRVEEPEVNLVYATNRLGRFVAFTKPQILMDKEGAIHIAHYHDSAKVRYTLASPQGVILSREDRLVTPNLPAPQLQSQPDGKVIFAGGLGKSQERKQPKLSEDQQGLAQ